MPRLSKHEKAGIIGMLQAGLSVTDIAQYCYCHSSTIQVLRDLCQATWMVETRHRSVIVNIKLKFAYAKTKAKPAMR